MRIFLSMTQCLIFIVGIACEGGKALTPVDFEKIRAEVHRATVDEYIAAWNAEDIDAISELWVHDDLTLFEGGLRQRIKGWENIKKWYQDSFDSWDEIDFKIVDPLIQLTSDGKVAIITYYDDIDFLDSKRVKRNIKPRVVVVKEKRNGTWKNLHGHASFSAEEMLK